MKSAITVLSQKRKLVAPRLLPRGGHDRPGWRLSFVGLTRV